VEEACGIAEIGQLDSWTVGQEGLSIYPNPVDNIVDCQFGIVDFQSIGLKIFDLYGREVRTVMDEAKSPGECTVRIDVSDLPEGVYLVRLQAGNEMIVTKICKR
jgi:hypothetical protein